MYDTEGIPPSYFLTGSARLDVYRKGGDSLSGRHFLYRLHPFTIKELLGQMESQHVLERILQCGGFPEPFLKGEENYAKRWRRHHLDAVLREDLLDLRQVRDIKMIEVMVDMLRERVGSLVSYSSLAEDLRVSVHTIKHWLQILEELYVVFPVRPYIKNIARSLLKETKYYFYDTGAVNGDRGARLENAVAGILLAELHLHEDLTGDRVALHLIRDKEKREVDFLTLVNKTPVHLIEVKWKDSELSKNLVYYHKRIPDVSAVQISNEARKRSTATGIHVLAAHEFLREISF